MIDEKKKIIDEIERDIRENPVKIVVGLYEMIQTLRQKNTDLAQMVLHGIPRKPLAYAKYHDIDLEDYL